MAWAISCRHLPNTRCCETTPAFKWRNRLSASASEIEVTRCNTFSSPRFMSFYSPSKSAYLRFLQLISAVDGLPWLADVDAHERALFDVLCLHWSQGQPLTVFNAIHQAQLGSSSTLHKRLKRLIAKDLIVARYGENNRRTKHLMPSDKGLACIHWLSTQLALVQTSELNAAPSMA
ncbi:MAG: hypothetical protein ACOYB1_10450 [Limnohabitans sp.]